MFSYRTLIEQLIDERWDSCHSLLKVILEAELTPYTQNGHYLETSTIKWKGKYERAIADRFRPSSSQPGEEVSSDVESSGPFTKYIPQSGVAFGAPSRGL